VHEILGGRRIADQAPREGAHRPVVRVVGLADRCWIGAL